MQSRLGGELIVRGIEINQRQQLVIIFVVYLVQIDHGAALGKFIVLSNFQRTLRAGV